MENSSSAQGSPPKPQPHLVPTRPTTLLLVALATGMAGWLLLDSSYSALPSLPWISSLLLAGLGVVEFFIGRTTRARIERKPDAGPIEPLLVVRLAALAKASSLVGAGYVGFFAGVGIWLWGQADRIRVAQADLRIAVVAIVCGVVLVVGALWLEYCCRIPRKDNESEQHSQNDSPPAAS